jgi:hypothetical protein
MIKSVTSYLKAKEWSLGNGQCPECYGSKPRHKWWTITVGHKADCVLAKALEEIKIKPIYEHINYSKERFRMIRDAKEIAKKIKTLN